MAVKNKTERLCNLCGESCFFIQENRSTEDKKFGSNYGLIDCTVSGGYESTPGNGQGTLDDLETYTFSLCEFCLDWLFKLFKTPPTLSDPDDVFQPAEVRVKNDDWRRQKRLFAERSSKRELARNLVIERSEAQSVPSDDARRKSKV